MEAAGATLAYRRYGAVDDTAILLLHGARMDGRIWARAARELARTHGVVVPDLRGRGHSSCDPAVPASFVADTLLLIDRLELSRFHLVGHSMGGGVALELAWRLSETTASPPLATLALVAPTLGSVILRASLTRLRDCGHDIPNESPDELAALIGDHVTAHS